MALQNDDLFVIQSQPEGEHYKIRLDDLTTKINSSGGGGGAVTSVNTQTGAVVLDADDIDDTSTTNKFATSVQLANADNAVQPTDSVSVLSDVNTLGASNDDVLSYNGTTWVPGSVNISSSSINDLNDVDTSTVAPTDGQALSWDNANSKWKPGTVAGGAVDSVNTFTGAVSLGIEDMDDFTLASADNIPYNTWDSTNTPAAGEWHINSSFFYLPKIDSNGADQSSNLRALDGTTSLTITQGGTDYVITNADLASDQLDDANARALISGSSGVISSIDSSITKSGGITISCPSFSLPLLPLADGDILQWVNADSKFKPVQLPAAVSSIDDLSDVDTSTVAPTDGQALTWDNTAGKWEPGTVAGGAVDSVNSQTGVVVLDADDIDDTSTTNKFATSAQLTNADNAVQPTDSVSALSDVNTSGAANGDVLSYDGATWVPGSIDISNSSIDDLNDVDTSTVAPTDGQTLVWDNANSNWKPGTVAGDAVDSVNSQTGVVVLDADDIDDALTTNKFVTSALISDITTAVQPEQLATVAISGNYKDLSDRPATAVPATGGTFSGEVTFSGDIYNSGIYTANPKQETGSTFDINDSNYHYRSLSGSLNVSFTGIPNARACSWTIELVVGSSITISWPNSIRWPGGTAPTVPSQVRSLFMFVTRDGGSNIYGSYLLDY